VEVGRNRPAGASWEEPFKSFWIAFEEAAAVLGIATPTAKEWWAFARAWLAVELHQSG
jgi:hypothetical protein